MHRTGKPLTFRDRYKGQLGQATIEYVLMLVVTVSLVLMLMFQVFKPMQRFLNAYMGLYVQCLLEYGELPALGGDSVVKDDGDCDAKFDSFSVADGRPPKGSSGGGSGSDKQNSDGSSSSDGSSASSSGGGGGGSSGSTYAGSSSRGGSRFMRRGRGTPGVDGAGGASAKVSEISADGSGSGGSFYTRSAGGETVIIRKVTKIPAENLSESMKRRLEKKVTGGKTSVIAADEGFGAPKKKMLVNKPPERNIASDDEETQFSIGNTIRFLFIVVIILIIVVFVGGQFLQMSKNNSE